MNSLIRKNMLQVAGLFLRLGLTAFGGPAAHIAMMYDEVVKRRKWLDDQEFLDLVGATNLIPGPNSTEMAIHLGFLRAGWPGLIAGGVAKNFRRLGSRALSLFLVPAAGAGLIPQASSSFSLPLLFFTFLKIGAVLYGSGYVLLAFLRADFVVRLGWLTDQQLLDAIAIGQVTPGPVFTTAAFLGYLLGGTSGALIATLGIFLPSFIFAAISSPLIPRMRKSVWVGSLLDGINVASLGLMAAVSWQLGVASLIDPLTIAIASASLFLLIRFKINSTWLIAAGGLFGLLSKTF